MGNKEFNYLSGCNDFELIKASVSHDTMANMEEAIRLYEGTDKIVMTDDGGLCHVDGEFIFTSAIAWYCGMIDTAEFISEFGEQPLSQKIQSATARAAEALSSDAQPAQAMAQEKNSPDL